MMDKLKKIFDPTFFRFILVGVRQHPGGLWCHVRPLQPGRAPHSGETRATGSPPPPTIWWAAWSASFSTSTSPSATGRRARGWCSGSRLNITVCWLLAYGLAKPVMELAAEPALALSPQLQGNLTMLAGSGLFVLLNYFGQRFFAFRSRT